MYLEVTYGYFILLAACFLVGLIIISKKPLPLHLKLFVPLFLLTLLVEVTGFILVNYQLNNVSLYNFFTTLEFVFYLFVLGRFINNTRFKKFLMYATWIYPAIALINIFFLQGLYVYHTYTMIPAALAVIFFSAHHIWVLIKTPSQIKLIREPSFLISLALLFFYSVTLPLMMILNFIYEHYPYSRIAFLAIIQLLPNFILYPLFTLALFVDNPKPFEISMIER